MTTKAVSKAKKSVAITLDKKRNIRYDLNALTELEDVLGVPLAKMGEVELGIKAIRGMLWAGLIHEDDALTIKQVGAMVDFENIAEVQEKVTLAFSMANPKN